MDFYWFDEFPMTPPAAVGGPLAAAAGWRLPWFKGKPQSGLGFKQTGHPKWFKPNGKFGLSQFGAQADLGPN